MTATEKARALAAELLTFGLGPSAALGLATLVDLVEATGQDHHGNVPEYLNEPLEARQKATAWLAARKLKASISGPAPDGSYLVELQKLS